jgi:hypothetical protein
LGRPTNCPHHELPCRTLTAWRHWSQHGSDEVGASLKWATAKVERTSQRGNGTRSQGRERQAERGGDFNDPPPF